MRGISMILIDHHQWLVENNLLTEEMKNNVAMLAYCLIEDTIDASTDIDFENKNISYKLIIPDELYKNLLLLENYKKKKELGFFERRRLKKFLLKKKENDESGLGYELKDIADKFIKTYFNKEWSTKVEFKSVKNYDGTKDSWLHAKDNQYTD